MLQYQIIERKIISWMCWTKSKKITLRQMFWSFRFAVEYRKRKKIADSFFNRLALMIQKLSGLQKFAIPLLLGLLFIINPEGVIFPMSSQKGILSNSPSPLKIPTYDGSGEITHPDAVCFEHPWNNYRFWITATPYPNRDSAYEDPSIFASNDGVNWSVPEGVSNPIARPPANTYLSDPDIIYHPSYGIRVYYRQVDKSHNRIFFIQSKNGREWTSPVETISVPNHHLISPAVVVLKSQYVMYSVKLSDDHSNTVVERRKSKDGIKWSLPRTVSVLNTEDKIIWHIDAAYVSARKEFWLLFYSYPAGSLYLAVSKDGLRFDSLPVPLLTGREDSNTSWDNGLYRSTFCVGNKGDFLLWYTGTKAPKASHIGFIRTDLARILSFMPRRRLP